MNSFYTILNQILILFIIMLIGFYAKKRGIINDTVSKKLSELLLMITNPLLVISAFQVSFTQEILGNVLIILVFAVAVHTITALAGRYIFRRCNESTRRIMNFAIVYSNCGFMGFPLLESLFGKVGVLYGSVYVAIFNIFVWTNGVAIFNSKERMSRESLKKVLLNPGIISVFIGMLLFIFSIKLPVPVASAVDHVGSMTVPLSMLIIGSTLAGCEFKKLFRGWDLYYVTAIRLILIPLLSFIILKLAGLQGLVLSVCVLATAMPVAATTTIFAEMYGGDSLFASRIVAFSTLASIVTIPLLMMLV